MLLRIAQAHYYGALFEDQTLRLGAETYKTYHIVNYDPIYIESYVCMGMYACVSVLRTVFKIEMHYLILFFLSSWNFDQLSNKTINIEKNNR